MNEIEALVVLSLLPGIGPIKLRFLLKHFGSALQAIREPSQKIAKLPGFKSISSYWNFWEKDNAWKKDLAVAKQLGIKLIPFTSEEFPKKLLSIPDHPALLYVKGELSHLDQRSIAVIGTRHASIYGTEMAAQIAKDLAAKGFTVISGLARGIDTAAHCGALSSGRTLAVIGSGLANIYPPENHPLAEKISTQGALISEFPLNTPPDRHNFPQRNRIVSGMSMGVVLIEAPEKSGAMITIKKAHLHERKVFVLPGRADQENFRGNHLLIKKGIAELVENADDIISHFETLLPKRMKQPSSHLTLSQEENNFLMEMPNQEATIQELLILSKLPIQQLHRILMSLILKKAVKEFPGKIYIKLLQ